MDDAREQLEFVSRAPAPALRSYVDGYVGYRVPGIPAAVHRGLPSRHLTMIVSIGDPIDVLEHTDPAQRPDRFAFVLSGLAVTPATIAAGGSQEGDGIDLTPLGCRALLRMPAGALWNTTVEAEAILGHAASELRARMHENSGWAARFAACDQVLSRILLAECAAVPAQLRGAWLLIARSHGTLAIADLAERLGWSRRHLAHRFAAEFGISPKAAARVFRFERACTLLRVQPRPPLAGVALACGYYDQPHLNREFAALAGCSPLEWVGTDIPSVQDGGQPGQAASPT